MKSGIAFLIILISIFIYVSMKKEKEVHYSSDGKLIYVPAFPERSISQIIGSSSNYSSNKVSFLKANLKNLGTQIIGFFDKKIDDIYPENPNDFDFETYMLRQSYLKGTDKELPQNWLIPQTWKEFNSSRVPFLFVRKSGEKYIEAPDRALFITKDGFQIFPNRFEVVFEDAHVETISREEAEKYWREAK